MANHCLLEQICPVSPTGKLREVKSYLHTLLSCHIKADNGPKKTGGGGEEGEKVKGEIKIAGNFAELERELEKKIKFWHHKTSQLDLENLRMMREQLPWFGGVLVS